MNLYRVNLNLYTSLTFADIFSLTAVTLCHIFTYQTPCGLSFYRDLSRCASLAGLASPGTPATQLGTAQSSVGPRWSCGSLASLRTQMAMVKKEDKDSRRGQQQLGFIGHSRTGSLILRASALKSTECPHTASFIGGKSKGWNQGKAQSGESRMWLST